MTRRFLTLPFPRCIRDGTRCDCFPGGKSPQIHVEVVFPLTPGPSPRWGEGEVDNTFNSLAPSGGEGARRAGEGVGRALFRSKYRAQLLWCVAIVVVCSLGARPELLAAQSKTLPPVILISVDTLRADRLSCYGARALQTPNIDSLTRGGTLFYQVSSQVPLTLPSHASMLTSTLPFSNKVEDLGSPLAPNTVTLASVLKSHGYRTAAFVGSFVLDRRFGLNQGFAIYDSPFNLRRQQRSDPGEIRRSGDEVVTSAIGWMRANSTAPFFVFLHLYDLHLPYQVPSSANPRLQGYEAALSYEDKVLGRFFGFLTQSGLISKSVILFTSDHGESLWEHGESSHGYFVYQSTVWVPLIIRWPEGTKGFPSRVETPASLLDLAPTILQFLDIPRPEQFQGRGLLDLVTSKTPVGPSEIYSESLYAQNHFACGSLRSLRLGRYKYIEAPQPEFYDLASDATEKHNLYLQQKSLAMTYRERLQALRARFKPAQADQPQAVSPEVASALNSLGYVAVSSASQNSRDSGPDPKDRVIDFESSRRAIDLSSTGHLAEAASLFEGLCAKYPDIADLRISLAVNQRRLGKNLEAIENFRQVLKLDALNVRAHFDLAVSLFELHQLEEALKELQVVLAMAPYYSRAAELAGTIRLQKKDYAGARSLFEQMLKSDEANYLAHYQLGTLATQEGKLQEAEQHLSAAVKADPQSVEALNGLGVLYLLAGKLEKASDTLAAAIRLEPKFAETHYNLGLVLRQQRKTSEAVGEFRAALAADPQFRPAREALNSSEFRTR